jgi:hypothetical protein
MKTHNVLTKSVEVTTLKNKTKNFYYSGRRRFQLKVIAAGVFAALTTTITPAHADAPLAPWLTQIGLTSTILAASNWGQGQTLAVVDTGFTYTANAFASGQVSVANSACAATSFKCSAGSTDDNGHGTAVMALAIGNGLSTYAGSTGTYTMTSGMQTSVAPNANGVAFKVLNAAGTGTATDVAAGITAAANSGAPVINVSITYSNAAAVVTAINYAASKGDYIVWAGGNSSTSFNGGAGTTGLTAAALSHLIIVGATDQNGAIASFSNVPGTGSLGTGTTYSSRWLMAPGSSMLVPTAGQTTYGAGSGTSFAAPVVAGSLLLLENAWPILKTNGLAENLLLATTTSTYTTTVTTPAVAAVYQTIAATPAVYSTTPAVAAVYKTVPAVAAVYKTVPAVAAVTKVVSGKTVVVTPAVPATQVLVTPAVPATQVLVTPAKPAVTVLVTPAVAAHQVLVTPAKPATTTTVVNNYGAGAGQGMLNLGKAFAPVGPLMAGNINISTLTISMLSGGALGSLSSITSKLSSYTVLDSYGRNFTVNLSGLIAKTPTALTVNPLPVSTNSGVTKIKFAFGDVDYMFPMSQNRFQDLSMYTQNDLVTMEERTNHSGYAMFTDGYSNSFVVGNAVPLPAQYTYSKLMYGNEEVAMMASDLGTHLTAYSQSNYGNITAYGTKIGDFRIAIGFNGTGTSPATGFNASTDTLGWDVAQARSVTRGVTYSASKDLTLGYSQTVLTEQHGVLGSTYNPSSAFSFGDGSHVSKETSISGTYNMDAHRSLYVEYSEAETSASNGSGGLVSGNSALLANSLGLSFSNKDAYVKDDKVSVTFKMPMQVTSGYTSMAITTVNADTGVATMKYEKVSLAPVAREMDLGIGYNMPLTKTQKLGLSAGYMLNYGGDAGTNIAKVGISWNINL